MTEVGRRLIKAAHEAAAIARGEKEPARVHVAADVNVREIRAGLGLTQEEFASEFSFSLNQIRDWEQGRSRPTDGMRAYLIIIEKNPTAVRSILNKVRAERRLKATKKTAAA